MNQRVGWLNLIYHVETQVAMGTEIFANIVQDLLSSPTYSKARGLL